MTVDLRNSEPISGLSTNSKEYIFSNRYNMYNDNYRDQVLKRLYEISQVAAELGIDRQIDMTNNVYKTIVNKISRVYISGVEREFADKNMEAVYKDNRIDKYMKQANRYVNAFNDVLMQVAWEKENNKTKFIFRYPHKTRVILDDMGDPSEVEYFIEMYTDGVEKWAYWSMSEHYYKLYKTDGSYVEQALKGNDGKVNPYDVLPFVFMQNGFRDRGFFDLYTGNNLIKVQLEIAVLNNFKQYMIK